MNVEEKIINTFWKDTQMVNDYDIRYETTLANHCFWITLLKNSFSSMVISNFSQSNGWKKRSFISF